MYDLFRSILDTRYLEIVGEIIGVRCVRVALLAYIS